MLFCKGEEDFPWIKIWILVTLVMIRRLRRWNLGKSDGNEEKDVLVTDKKRGKMPPVLWTLIQNFK